MAQFPGFPQQALQFYKDIAQNNNREWFELHKEDFTRYVQEPAQDFVIVLGTKLQELSKDMVFDPSLRGSGSIMRIYRDIRFSKDKTPYKSYLGMRFWEGPSRKEMFSGLFIWLDDSGAGLHLGQHGFSKDYLTAFREAVDDPHTGSQLEQVLADAEAFAKIGGDRYVRVPRGYDQEHPRGELLKYKAVYATSARVPPEVVTSEAFLPLCLDYFKRLLPLHSWLVGVGKSL